ncbi:hypothetical protein B0J15DRAFT_549851 [Fusarium solani]|uniref:Lysine-specific metallo-endopeptidase domain-containing protein n=1 Tax=Fusarium solani TaxID=169388 RepID=A0A9P9KD82_FUSSL|nr:uncharacterized protein B0J15DRAFT_549851 [Fusarium solani]KAH7253121.1 hypothetical protein B0J15DRAFT_549851 [Fusarium solani]
MSFKFSPSLAPWLARLTILLAFVSPTIQGTISARAGTIDDVFHIKTGTEKGGCDDYDVVQWWNDGRVLAGAADQVLRNARTSKANGVTNSDSQKHLWTFFKVDAADDSFDSTVDTMIANLTKVRDAIDDESEGEDGDDKPWIFCDSTFQAEMKWTATALIEGTGAEDPDKRQMRKVYADIYEVNYLEVKKKRDKASKTERAKIPQPFVPFWCDDLKAFRYDEPGDYCSKGRGKQKTNMGATDDNLQPNTLTFCPQNWGNAARYPNMFQFPDVTAEGVSMEEYTVEALTFLHEMFHFALENENTPDTAYLLGEIVGSDVLADGAAITQEQAIANPESWTLFALACYLGTRFPDYTWASTKSKLRQS